MHKFKAYRTFQDDAKVVASRFVDMTLDELDPGDVVVLHDPAGNDAWSGTFRCVAYARAEIDPELVSDPLLAGVGWSWLTEALDAHGAEYVMPSGSVTCVSSESFGGW